MIQQMCLILINWLNIQKKVALDVSRILPVVVMCIWSTIMIYQKHYHKILIMKQVPDFTITS